MAQPQHSIILHSYHIVQMINPTLISAVNPLNQPLDYSYFNKIFSRLSVADLRPAVTVHLRFEWPEWPPQISASALVKVGLALTGITILYVGAKVATTFGIGYAQRWLDREFPRPTPPS